MSLSSGPASIDRMPDRSVEEHRAYDRDNRFFTIAEPAMTGDVLVLVSESLSSSSTPSTLIHCGAWAKTEAEEVKLLVRTLPRRFESLQQSIFVFWRITLRLPCWKSRDPQRVCMRHLEAAHLAGTVLGFVVGAASPPPKAACLEGSTQRRIAWQRTQARVGRDQSLEILAVQRVAPGRMRRVLRLHGRHQRLAYRALLARILAHVAESWAQGSSPLRAA